MLFFYLLFFFLLLMILIPLYVVCKALQDIYDYRKKTYGFYVYSKKYKRSQRFLFRNGKYTPEYILNGEKWRIG